MVMMFLSASFSFFMLLVMGKDKVHAYLRITQSTFFYCSLTRLDKRLFATRKCEPGKPTKFENRISTPAENRKSLSLVFIFPRNSEL